MKKHKNLLTRALAALLTVIMLVGIAPLTGFVGLFGVEASAANQNEGGVAIAVDKFYKSVERIDKGNYPYYRPNGVCYAGQCNGFVNALWYNVFGYDMYHSSKRYSKKIDNSNGNTIRDCITQNGRIGDIIRTEGDWTHSYVIRGITSSKLVVYEYGGNETYSYGAHRSEYTWAKLASTWRGSNCRLYKINDSIYTKIDNVKPSVPTISLNVSTDIASGTPVAISWKATSSTNGYRVYVNGAKVQENNKTAYSFTPTAGEYKIYVEAYNSKNLVSKSNEIKITVHDPLQVSFVGLNGKDLGTLEVKYGSNAIAPDVPTEEGYTFLGWDNSTNRITEDITVTAQYEINTYSVSFIDSDGNPIGKAQSVEHGSAAAAPVAGTDFVLPVGYEFLGWDTVEYLTVKSDLTVRGIYAWGNEQLPIVADITQATRQDDGYYVYFDLTNYPNSITRGRAVISLKTAEGKLVDTTESAAFSIPKNGTKTGMEVFIPCEKSATNIEVIIVDSYKSGVPISEKETAVIDQGLEWSDWSETEPEVEEGVEIEQREEYRTSVKETLSETNTQSEYTKEGWTLDNRTSEWGDYGAWSPWSKTVATASDSRKVETNEKIDKAAYTKYNLYYYRYWNTDRNKYMYTFSSGMGGKKYSKTVNSTDVEYYNTYSGHKGYVKKSDYYLYSGELWFIESTTNVPAVKHTEYRYADRTLNYTHNFYRWTDWSDWSVTPSTATDTQRVETRTVYRYRSTDVGVEDNGGEMRTVSGTLDSSLAGKQATLYVYKIDEASDWTNEYVGQSVIAPDGSYSFTFKLREEPTIKTGDFTVALGIEGSNGMTVIDAFEAPVPQYTVTFYDYNGNIVKTETVNEFSTATPPENPTRDGYDFCGWDNSLTNVKCDMEVNPRFVKKAYTVVFVNWTTQTIETKTFEHGDFLTGPEVEPVEGTSFTGWSGVIDGTTVVTSNMIVTAEYTKDNCEVVFYDFDGNAVSTQNVDYGDSIEVPDDLLRENYVFLGWASDDGDLDFSSADGNKAIYPVYAFDETVATPTASVSTGTYTQTQTVTLSCETQGAVIYYSTDGSDPLDGENHSIYSQPLTIDKSTQLRFAACAFEMNDSETAVEFYAINTDNMSSEWLTYSEIPQFVLDDLATYSLVSQTGYKYKNTIDTAVLSEIDSLTADGWTDEGVTSTSVSEASLEYPAVDDLDYTVNEITPDPVAAIHYQYSHFKYYDEESGDYQYSKTEIEGVTGETETVTVPTTLTVSGFLPGTTTQYYNYNNEPWFNQTPVTVYVPAGYLIYTYTTNVHTLSKWSDWSIEAPAAQETRETQTDTVYCYTIPEYRVVTVVSELDEENRKVFFFPANEVLAIDAADYAIDGYTFEGFYTDAQFTAPWDMENGTVTQDITLYAKYSINTYSVAFNNSDGTPICTQQVEHFGEAEPPEVTVADGYVHVGWDTDDYLCVTENLTVTANVVAEEDVTRVTLSRAKYTMMEGSYYKLLATVTPNNLENKRVEWISSNYDVIDVDENGNVYAVGAGTAAVTATAFDSATASCVFTVIGNPDNFVTLKPTTDYTVDEAGYIRGVVITTDEEEDTHLAQTVAEVKAQFVNDDLVFTDINGSVLDDSAYVGTGTTAAIMNGNVPVDFVTFIVTGDTNGDGAINNRDAALATRYLVDKESPNVAQMIALDVNGDGYVNNRDASMLSRYLVGKESI